MKNKNPWSAGVSGVLAAGGQLGLPADHADQIACYPPNSGPFHDSPAQRKYTGSA